MELLIRRPGTARESHDEGDVFAIYPDGSLPEPPAPGSVFWRVIVTDVPPALWEHLLESTYDTTDPMDPSVVVRRAYRVRWERVPNAIVNTLTATRTVTISATEFKNAWIERKP